LLSVPRPGGLREKKKTYLSSASTSFPVFLPDEILLHLPLLILPEELLGKSEFLRSNHLTAIVNTRIAAIPDRYEV
jgi:hypothetical protein